jgi:hypothetical protein
LKTKITNVDTLSALYDRLICENVKLYFFKKDNDVPKIDHQIKVLSELKVRLADTFKECLEEHDYDFLSEKRTFNIDGISEELERLVHNDVEIGEADRARLAEVSKPHPDVITLVREEARLRVSNEGRAKGKNIIDSLFKKIFK